MTARAWIILLVLVLLAAGGAVALRKLGETEEQRRQRLLPQVRAAFDRVRAELSATHGIELVIVSTRRTEDEQAVKVAEGKSTTNNSWHLLGRALDVQTARKSPTTGKYVADPNGKDLDSYKRLHEVARRHGFRGIPNGSPFTSEGKKALLSNGVWDVYHIEYPEGMTFAQAAAKAAQVA